MIFSTTLPDYTAGRVIFYAAFAIIKSGAG
jgi:hypothetical protein